MINWFPGHMNKTLKQMQADSKLCSCFVYVLDARCPISCVNPEFLKVVKDKPIIYVLNKIDLVNVSDAEKFKQYFTTKNSICLTLNATQSGNAKLIIKAINKIFSSRFEQNKQNQVNFITRVMVIGVPNSGKSTIVNNLCKKSLAVTGNRAGVTKSKQWVKVSDNIEFMDTPGVLLPNFEDEQKAYNLAIVGSVKDEVVNPIDVALHLIAKLKEIDINILNTKYGVDSNTNTPDFETLNQIAIKRGCKIKGGELDLERASKILLSDFRSGKLGKICLDKLV